MGNGGLPTSLMVIIITTTVVIFALAGLVLGLALLRLF
jgi:hypothetical protein